MKVKYIIIAVLGAAIIGAILYFALNSNNKNNDSIETETTVSISATPSSSVQTSSSDPSVDEAIPEINSVCENFLQLYYKSLRDISKDPQGFSNYLTDRCKDQLDKKFDRPAGVEPPVSNVKMYAQHVCTYSNIEKSRLNSGVDVISVVNLKSDISLQTGNISNTSIYIVRMHLIKPKGENWKIDYLLADTSMTNEEDADKLFYN